MSGEGGWVEEHQQNIEDYFWQEWDQLNEAAMDTAYEVATEQLGRGQS
jgi:hypothetical protein